MKRLLVLGLLVALPSVCAAERYGVKLEQRDVAAEAARPIVADFDGDAVADRVEPYGFYFSSLTVNLSATGKRVTIGAGADSFNGVDLVHFRSDGKFPGLVFASYGYNCARQPTCFDYAQQLLVTNDRGTFTVHTLPIRTIGRDVACTRGYPGRANPVCFWGSYHDNAETGASPSKLVELLPDGGVVDITAAARLPFPARIYNRGIFAVGVGWGEFDGDALPDLVVGAQHSPLLVAHSRADGSMAWAWWGPEMEHMRAWPAGAAAPCAYVAIENDWRGGSDYVACYDREARSWYPVALPVSTWSYKRVVRFERRDGRVLFAADAGPGRVHLFALVPGPAPPEPSPTASPGPSPSPSPGGGGIVIVGRA